MSLICIDAFPGHPRFKGLGELSADELGPLFDTRQAITSAQYELAARAWDAFRADSPQALGALLRTDTHALPFLAAALGRHLEDYPWTRDGLSRTERRVMSLAQAGPIDIWTAFPLMHEDETAFYIADQSFWQVVTELASATPPLVAVDVRFERRRRPYGRYDHPDRHRPSGSWRSRRPRRAMRHRPLARRRAPHRCAPRLALGPGSGEDLRC